jgi:fatty acid desaturase
MCLRPEVKSKLASRDQWLENFNIESFTADVKELGEKLEKNQGPEDVKHLNKMIMWSNLCGFVGLAMMGFGVNIYSIVGLSTFTFTRWTMIAHHTCHGGYDKCHPKKDRWNRFKFAIGSLWRRYCDWFDWMLPEAWNVEHNNRHHYNLSEVEDPDLVENNLSELREMDVSLALKYFVVSVNIVTWKWQYYAPNTYKELKLAKMRREGKSIPKGVNPSDAVTIRSLVSEGTAFYSLGEFMSVVFLPYLIWHFILLPLPLLFIGQHFGIENMFGSAIKNLLLAELLTNAHAFVAVVPNHAGDDMYRFREGCRPFSGSFFLRQVLASVDFWTGSDINDFLHGYLNYQIEHHMWPNLSMLSYKRSQPLVKEICRKHGVPYVQENVFTRTKKTIDIMTGQNSMIWFPADYEKKFLEIDAQVLERKKTASKAKRSIE